MKVCTFWLHILWAHLSECNAKVVWTLLYVPVRRRRILLVLLFVVLWVTLFLVSTPLSVLEDYFGAQNFYRNQVIPLATPKPAATTSPTLCFRILKSIGKGVQVLMRHFSALAAASSLLVEKAVEQIQPGGTGLSVLHKWKCLPQQCYYTLLFQYSILLPKLPLICPLLFYFILYSICAMKVSLTCFDRGMSLSECWCDWEQ